MPMGVYPRTYRPLEERFWSHVEKTDTCWLWKPTGKTGDYGRIRVRGRGPKIKTHRLSWEMHFGPIPNGLQVLHRCDTPPCVNPAHLFLGTHADNHADKAGKGRQVRGEAVVVGKLTADLVRMARARVAAGETRRQVAQDLGVSATSITWAVNRKTWKHVD